MKISGNWLLIRVSSLTLAVGRYALNYSYVLAIPSQAKLAPYEPDRGSQKDSEICLTEISLLFLHF